MLEFRKIDESAADELAAIYQKCDYAICDYSAGVKLMWTEGDYCYAYAHGCLIVGATWDGTFYFDFPVAVDGSADIEKALRACTAYCAENFLPFYVDLVPQSGVATLLRTFRCVDVCTMRSFDDYLYLADDLIKFEGKKYAGQRNHIRKFFSLYPNARFRVFTEADKPALLGFFDEIGKNIATADGKEEWFYARKMLDYLSKPYFLTGGYEADGKILSFCLGEICGDTLVEHIEKGLPDYEGVYPATVQAYAKAFAGGVKYVNREDDAGSRGLRISKMQYQPTAFVAKRYAKIKTPIENLSRVPTLRGENGLTLTPIREADIPDYNRLCLDDERNRLWGYDYREACENPDERYFYLDQKTDFRNRTAMNFAIRERGKFLGEVVLYNFDCAGGAELGVRILPEADGRGVGRAAYKLAAEYALYHLDLFEVRGKCKKENLPSLKMLSSVMHKTGEDETYFYFRKLV